MSIQQHNPPHPGGFITRIYLEPFNLGSNDVAKKLMVSPSTFSRLVNEKADVSPEMALKLSKVFGRSAESWLLMQATYDLYKARQDLSAPSLEAIKY